MPPFNLEVFISNLFFYLPFGLGLIAVIQIMYIVFLSFTSQTEASSRQPTSPVMPANTDGAWSQSRLSQGLPEILSQVGAGPMTGGMSTDHGLMGRFVIEAGTPEVLALKEFDFPADEFVIGRYEDTRHNVLLSIDEPSVSRRHCFFEGDEDLQEYYLTDEESTYGTYLLKQEQFVPLSPNIPERLYNQDVIQIGGKVRLRVILPTETRNQAIR